MSDYGVVFKRPRGKFKVRPPGEYNKEYHNKEHVELRVKVLLYPEEIAMLRTQITRARNAKRKKQWEETDKKEYEERGLQPAYYWDGDEECYAGSDDEIRDWVSAITFDAVKNAIAAIRTVEEVE